MKSCPTKVVIRRLPPKLSEDEFRKIIDPLPCHTYFRFCTPDPSLGYLGMCRAYITFNDIDALFEFKERFDNYVFIDSEGNESFGLVEFAVCQTLATTKESVTTKKSEKVDKKQGTLQDDAEFINFSKSLQPAEEGSETTTGSEQKKTPWEAILEEIQARETSLDKGPETTPLLTYLNQREHRRKDDDNARHRKPYKQFMGGQRKVSRGELPAQRPPPPSQGRRVNDSKRGSHSNRDAGYGRTTEEDGQYSNKDKVQSNKAFNAEEFPAMQESQKRGHKKTSGPHSDRTIWGGASFEFDSSVPTVTVPKKPAIKVDPSKRCVTLADSEEDLAKEKRINKKSSKPHIDRVDFDDTANTVSIRKKTTTKLDTSKRSVTPTTSEVEVNSGRTRKTDSWAFIPQEGFYYENEPGKPGSPSMDAVVGSTRGGRRTTSYHPGRGQSGGGPAQTRKPASRGRRDSDDSVNHPSDTAPPQPDSDQTSTRTGRGRRGGNGRPGNAIGDPEFPLPYHRGGYRGGYQNFRNSYDSPYQSSHWSHGDQPYAPSTKRGGGGGTGTPRGRGGHHRGYGTKSGDWPEG